MLPITRFTKRVAALLEDRNMDAGKVGRNWLTVMLIAAGALGAVANPRVSAAAVDVFVQIAPPAPRYEPLPALRVGYVWVPGYWNWRGHRHVWVAGVWVKERHGYHFQPHRWVERNGGWFLDRGRWDRDGDGIPNRYDRHPNNPYRP